MGGNRIFNLAVFFQQLIRDRTSTQVDFINGPRRGLTFKAAKNLLVFTDGDVELAKALIEQWATSDWEMEHNADNLMRVYQCANQLLVDLRKEQPGRRPPRGRDLSLYHL